MTVHNVPFIIRGKIIDDYTLEFGGRKSGSFRVPDMRKHLNLLLNCPMASMAAYQDMPIEEIARFLHEVGKILDFEKNAGIRQAYELSSLTSGISASVLESMYRNIPGYMFTRDNVMEHAEKTVGINYLEGWVEERQASGTVTGVRAYGAKGVHIIAGNTPGVAFMTALRSAITRSDAIIKVPSNDPLTMGCVLQAMIDVDPSHLVTQHMSCVYWKGGDEQLEHQIYHPSGIEKIVAWGGFDSIKHITKYLQPGLDLITLDPKHSASVVGKEALADDQTMRHVAKRAAADIGAFNQEACSNARTIYVECDPDDNEQLENLNAFGQYVFDALQTLPPTLSTRATYIQTDLKEELDGLFFMDDYYKVYREDDYSGAIIVSQSEEPVSFAGLLACRTANIVPVKSLASILSRINSESQTIGVYPVSLKRNIRSELAVRGAQMIVSLGYVSRMSTMNPLDAIETERRMVKWVTDQTQDESLPPPWERVG